MTEITKTQDQNVRKYSGSNKMPLSKLRSAHFKRPASSGRGIILLADISGSMRGEKMDHLKKALNQVWQGREGLKCICFESELWEIDKPDIATLSARGTTQMWAALKEAWTRKPEHVILMTDGIPDEPTLNILADVRAHKHVRIDTVGIDSQGLQDFDPDFLKQIADITGGKYNDVSQPIMLPNVLKGLLIRGTIQL